MGETFNNIFGFFSDYKDNEFSLQKNWEVQNSSKEKVIIKFPETITANI